MAPLENPPPPGSLTIPMPYEKPDPDYNDWVWGWAEICRGDLCKKVMMMMMCWMLNGDKGNRDAKGYLHDDGYDFDGSKDKLMLLSTMMMNVRIIQDFWTCKRIAFTIFLVWQGVLGFFAVYGIFYVAGFFC